MKARMHSLIEKRLRNRQDELRGGLADHPHGRRADPRYRYESSPQLELREVESALRRLEDRTYGICRQCGQPIADGRLYAVPHTDRCNHCVAEP